MRHISVNYHWQATNQSQRETVSPELLNWLQMFINKCSVVIHKKSALFKAYKLLTSTYAFHKCWSNCRLLSSIITVRYKTKKNLEINVTSESLKFGTKFFFLSLAWFTLYLDNNYSCTEWYSFSSIWRHSDLVENMDVILYVMFITDILTCDWYHSVVTVLHLMAVKKFLTALMSWSSSHVRELNEEQVPIYFLTI